MVVIQRKKDQFTITLPKDVVSLMGWGKGVELYPYPDDKGNLILKQISGDEKPQPEIDFQKKAIGKQRAQTAMWFPMFVLLVAWIIYFFVQGLPFATSVPILTGSELNAPIDFSVSPIPVAIIDPINPSPNTTPFPSDNPSPAPTPFATFSPTPSETASPAPTPSTTPFPQFSPSPSSIPMPSEVASPAPTPSFSPTPTQDPSPNISPTPTQIVSP
ncbi:MAG: hypothetical protein AABY04_02495, partial [Candidatus Micrarchaeota archaeon]